MHFKPQMQIITAYLPKFMTPSNKFLRDYSLKYHIHNLVLNAAATIIQLPRKLQSNKRQSEVLKFLLLKKLYRSQSIETSVSNLQIV